MTRARRLGVGPTFAIALGLLTSGFARAEGVEGAAPRAFGVRRAGPLPSRDIRWQAVLGAAVDGGSLPSASPGIAAGLDVRRGGLAARVVTSVFLPQREHGVVAATPTGALASGASIALFDVTAVICALAPISARLDAGLCGGGGLGLLYASGRIDTSRATDHAFRLQATALARVDVILSRVFVLSFDAGVVADPIRPTLRLGADDVHRPPAFAPRGSLALHVRF